MKKIKILSDSTSDLSKELLEKYDIAVLPLQVNLGEESRFDGKDVTPDEIYAWADKNGKTPTTSAPSPDAAEKFIGAYAADYDLIVFTISSEMSSTYQVLCNAASNFPESKITVIDSRNLSTGIGLQVVTAAEMAKNGADYDAIIAKINEIIPKVRAGFVVEDVLFLHKGGRCSALAAFGATALKLRPTLAVVDGFIKVDKKVRGDIHSATMKYAKGLEENILNADEEVVFITHSGTSQEIIDDVYAYVSSLNKFKNIYITRAGCVVSSHCGAGTLGVLFISK
ncbi:MAG: DegV family protein [Clostridia bacterium]|nr:DegV family protein [Clostridia bacterium]